MPVTSILSNILGLSRTPLFGNLYFSPTSLLLMDVQGWMGQGGRRKAGRRCCPPAPPTSFSPRPSNPSPSPSSPLFTLLLLLLLLLMLGDPSSSSFICTVIFLSVLFCLAHDWENPLYIPSENLEL